MRVLEMDGHIRYETNVDTGLRSRVELKTCVKRPESVLELARKFAEINAIHVSEPNPVMSTVNTSRQMDSTSKTSMGTMASPRSPSSIKDALLKWVQSKVQDYPVQITNFSSSWADGMAFCALIHRFAPQAFDFKVLSPVNRKHNLELAFRVAEDNGIYALLEVEDMLDMGDRPDWKCVFTYVQQFYKQFRDHA